MNIFYLHEEPQKCAYEHCDKHVVKMIIEYAQLMSTAHRVLDGELFFTLSKNNRKIKRYKLPDERDDKLMLAVHENHPSNIWLRQSDENYKWLWQMWFHLNREYTYRYGKVHMTDSKLRELLNELPRNIPLGDWREPPQCMPDDVKTESAIPAYHKYYAVYKKDFAKWTDRPTPQFMSA